MFRDFYYIKDIKFNNFNTEYVENFSEMFDTCTALVNLDVSMFNTSNATNMYEMFKSCQQLSTINISNFDISKVTNIQGMFAMNEVSSSKLNEIIGLENLDTSQVTSMAWLFNGCENLQNLNIVNWDTIQVTSMHSMFHNCKSLTSLDLSNWDTNNVTDMTNMFTNAYNLELINLGEKFNIGNSTNITSIFAKCSKLSGEITIKNVINGERLYVFKDCSTDPSAKFIVKYTNGTTKEVAKNLVTTKSTNSNVFLDGESSTLLDGWTFNQKLSSMQNFANVKEIRFIQATPPKSGGIDVSQARDKSIRASIEGTILTVASESQIYANPNCTNMFNQYGYSSGTNKVLNKITFDNFNTSKVTNMDSMFRFCNLLTSLDLSKFDTSKVTNMNVMFRACKKLTEIKGIEKFDTNKVTTSNYMFYNCENLSGKITIMNPYVNSYTEMFVGCSINPTSKFEVNYIGDFTKSIAEKMVSTKSLNSNVVLGGIPNSLTEVTQPATLMEGEKFRTTLEGMSGFENVEEIRFIKGTPSPNGTNVAVEGEAKASIEGTMLTIASEDEIFANSNCSNMFHLFGYTQDGNHINKVLNKITLNNFNTSKVTNMRAMFNGCSSLTSLDISGFDTSNVTNMEFMFNSCSSLTELNLNNFDTSKVTSMSNMFSNCSIKNIDLSKFDTSNVTNMKTMFYNCWNLNASITISNPDIKEYQNMFLNCSTTNTINEHSKFIVNYTSNCKTIAQKMVDEKRFDSNVILGTEVNTLNEDIPNKEEPSVPDTIVLTIKDGNKSTIKEILVGEIGSLNTPSKEGMVFSGYFYDIEYTKPVSERDVISEDTTIYIKWEEVPQEETSQEEEVPQNEEILQEENKDESFEVA